MSNADLAAIPLFIFMASMLEKAGLNAVLINEPYDATLKVKELPIELGTVDAGPVAPSDQEVSA